MTRNPTTRIYRASNDRRFNHMQEAIPCINFPCKKHIAQFVHGFTDTPSGEVIALNEKNFLGVALLGYTCSVGQYLETQSEIDYQYPAQVRFSFPPTHRTEFYLTDQSIIKINAFLEDWFRHTVRYQILQGRSVGISQVDVIKDLMAFYDIDETDISSDALKKMSFRWRSKIGKTFTRGQMKRS